MSMPLRNVDVTARGVRDVGAPQLGSHTYRGAFAYGVLLSAFLLTAAGTLLLQWDRAVVSVAFYVGTITYLCVLERLITYTPEWHPTRAEWATYGAYFLITVVVGGTVQVALVAVVEAIGTPHPSLPFWAELPVAILLQSLIGYATHRACHTNRWLWKVHGVHHAPDKVNVANNTVNHALDVVFNQAAVQLGLAVAGFSAESVFVLGLLVIVQGFFIHANIDVRIGRLNYFLASPEQHRLHHSTRLAEAGNFSADMPLWDLVFGTFTWRPGRRPAAVGLMQPGSFPPLHAFVAILLHPWKGTTPARRAPSTPSASLSSTGDDGRRSN